MKQKKYNKKAVFQKSGSGYRLTTAGQSYYKEAYGVKAGKKPWEPKEAE